MAALTARREGALALQEHAVTECSTEEAALGIIRHPQKSKSAQESKHTRKSEDWKMHWFSACSHCFSTHSRSSLANSMSNLGSQNVYIPFLILSLVGIVSGLRICKSEFQIGPVLGWLCDSVVPVSLFSHHSSVILVIAQ